MIHYFPDQVMSIPHRRDVSFKELTTLGIGGVCRWLFEPINELQVLLFIRNCCKEGIPWRIIGSGSNILAHDNVFMPVLKLNFDEYLYINERAISVSANYKYSKLSLVAAHFGLAGLEYAVGIPGTVGGAIYMNAGAHNAALSNLLVSYKFLTFDGYIVEKSFDVRDFGYRWSEFQYNKLAVILSVTISLVKEEINKIKNLMRCYINERNKKQPLGYRNAGCIFKNPSGYSAGWLIDQAGLKGLRIGDAGISCKHGNFLVNYGNANRIHFLDLIYKIQEKVKMTHDVYLEPEIDIW